MYLFGTLRTTNQVSSSSIFFERRQTSLLLISPKPWKSQQTVDGKIALQLRGKSCIFYLGGGTVTFTCQSFVKDSELQQPLEKASIQIKFLGVTSARHLEICAATFRPERRQNEMSTSPTVLTVSLLQKSSWVLVCVCVCMWERESERDRDKDKEREKDR